MRCSLMHVCATLLLVPFPHRLMTAMSEGQWRVKPFMLSTMEKVMYVRLDTHSGSAASKTSPGSSSSSSSTAPVVREVQ